MSYYGYPPYVSVAQRRENARKEVQKLAKKGQVISPVTIDGKKIATTFWGKAWCDNLCSYSDLASRLPKGRSYVKNGSVVDLQINPGEVTAMVAGSHLYRVKIKIEPLAAATWTGVRRQSMGQIGSVIELLKGSISANVMSIVTNQQTGLFPSPKQIDFSCSCPDFAYMCKHVAATLYGVGNRLDHQPELLFKLRGVDPMDLIADAAAPVLPGNGGDEATIADADLGDVFGIELDEPVVTKPRRAKASAAKKKPRKR